MNSKRSGDHHRRGKKRDRTQAFAVRREEPALGSSSKAQENDSKQPPRSSSLEDVPVQESELLQENPRGSQQKPATGSDRLDLLSYHRGREGYEPRHKDTGQLLRDVPATDSNHNAGGPRSWVTSVLIEFPLEDTGKKRRYKELLDWDLSSPSMPTPTMYAMEVAQQFGLSYSQSMDLAASIQKQLQTFCSAHCAYTPAVLLESQQPKPSPLACYLYGEVTGFGQTGGHCFPNQQKQQRQPQRSHSSSSLQKSKVGAKASGTKRTKPPPEKPDDYFHPAIRSRLRLESEQEIRMKMESSEANASGDGENTNDSTPLPLDVIKTVDHGPCHLCNKPLPIGGTFLCSMDHHTVCNGHLLYHFGFSLQSKLQQQLRYCPICTLECPCQTCTRQLKDITKEFRKRFKEQGAATPETTLFTDLLAHSREAQSKSTFSTYNSAGRRIDKKRISKDRPKVPKISRGDFPKETAEGVDVDHDYAHELCTVYSADGAVRLSPEDAAVDVTTTTTTTATTTESASVAAPPDVTPVVVVEDGSIDFCIKCQGEGSLLCCDFCPRAYHGKCVPKDCLQKDADSEKWECPACVEEAQGLRSDEIDGSMSLNDITDTWSAGRKGQPVDKEKILLLSIIHDMVRFLMKYDFGYIFKSPVDTKVVENYKAIVKNPMDLGTISARMIKGRYKSDGSSLESVAVAALKDLALIWHNCLLFNLEGSAVYRMAIVLRKRAEAIQAKSFDQYLTKEMKQEIQNYVDSLRKERDAAPKKVSSTATPSGQRHKITTHVGGSRSHRKRPIAVLDPDTGRVVKVYTSASSTANAVCQLLSSPLECEWERTEINNLGKLRRSVLINCASDPSVLLFGYRWLFLDELHDEKVSFDTPALTKKNADGGQVRLQVHVSDGTSSWFYGSLEESLSHPSVQGDVETARTTLRDLSLGGEQKEMSGASWTMVERSDEVSESSTVFVREDLVSGGIVLAEFVSEAAAFADWKEAIESSFGNYRKMAATLELFRAEFLDSECHVDGMRWRKLAPVPKPPAEIESKSDTAEMDTETSEQDAEKVEPATGQNDAMVVDGDHQNGNNGAE